MKKIFLILKIFANKDLWEINPENKIKALFFKILKIILFTFKKFRKDNCIIKSSSLTFYSLLSIIPIVSILFAIAKGFGFEKLIEKFIRTNFKSQEKITEQILKYSNNLLETTKGDLIAIIGISILFWTIIKVISNIEYSFNEIWGVKKQRLITRKISDYTSIILVSPILIGTYASLNVFIKAKFNDLVNETNMLKQLSPIIYFLLKLSPFIIICALLFIIYLIIPNIKVKIMSALIGGITAGVFYQILQYTYLNLQVGVVRYNAIYGGFAILPLFMIWLNLSWIIILLGAEISFAIQNIKNYEMNKKTSEISYSLKLSLTLEICYLIVKRFENGDKVLTEVKVSEKLGIPIRITRDILYDLVEARILLEVKTKNYNEWAYVPAKDINKLSVIYIIKCLERKGTNRLHQEEKENYFFNLINSYENCIIELGKDILLKDI